MLGFPAAEVAAMLSTSPAAVKSTLQRARARLEEVAPAPERVIESVIIIGVAVYFIWQRRRNQPNGHDK